MSLDDLMLNLKGGAGSGNFGHGGRPGKRGGSTSKGGGSSSSASSPKFSELPSIRDNTSNSYSRNLKARELQQKINGKLTVIESDIRTHGFDTRKSASIVKDQLKAEGYTQLDDKSFITNKVAPDGLAWKITVDPAKEWVYDKSQKMSVEQDSDKGSKVTIQGVMRED